MVHIVLIPPCEFFGLSSAAIYFPLLLDWRRSVVLHRLFPIIYFSFPRVRRKGPPPSLTHLLGRCFWDGLFRIQLPNIELPNIELPNIELLIVELRKGKSYKKSESIVLDSLLFGFPDPAFRGYSMFSNLTSFGNLLFGNLMFGNLTFGNSMFGNSMFGNVDVLIDSFFYNVFQPTRVHPPSSLRWDKSS